MSFTAGEDRVNCGVVLSSAKTEPVEPRPIINPSDSSIFKFICIPLRLHRRPDRLVPVDRTSLKKRQNVIREIGRVGLAQRHGVSPGI